MPLMPVTDSMFLFIETREHPMHVGGLELFTPPEGSGPEYLRDLRRDLLDNSGVQSLFRQRLARPLNSLGYLAWTEDAALDLDYHFRHSALPRPGRVRELLELTSHWHSSLLDRHRPLWEMQLVEGLADGRFALYSKVHHALMDGVSAVRQLQSFLSDDPDTHDCPAPWDSRQPQREEQLPLRPAGLLSPATLLRTANSMIGQVAGVAPMAVKVATEAFRLHRLTLPLQAPRTMLNVPIGGARRFAAQSWPVERVRQVAKDAGVARNDVILAMCAGALRDYLIEQRALPDASLVAMVPVSLRGHTGAGDASGNQLGALLCDLGTSISDPASRLAVISRSMSDGKRLFQQLTPLQVLLLSALNVAPLAASPVPGFVSHTRPPFNIVISNVPGPRHRMYWNGATLDGIYPASVLFDGQALNITLTSNGANLDFGITGCRQSVPRLQRLLIHLDTALAELESATA